MKRWGLRVLLFPLSSSRALSSTTDAEVLTKYRRSLRVPVSDRFWEAFVAASERPLRPSLALTHRRRGGPVTKGTRVPWWPLGYFVDEDRGLDVGHVTGQYYLQEAAAMLPVAALVEGLPPRGPLEEEEEEDRRRRFVAVDVCAAPGGKTIQLSQVPNVSLVANDASSSRLASLAHNVARCGAVVAISHSDGERLLLREELQEGCDLVLLDAPCSGDTQSRRSEVTLAAQLLRNNESPAGTKKKKRQRKDDVADLVETQKRLLRAAVRALRPPKGRVVYSTCSLDPRENEDVVAAILDEFKGEIELDPPDLFKGIESDLLPGTARLWPQTYDTAGFFAARLVRRVEESPPPGRRKKHPQKKKESLLLKSALEAYLRERWDLPSAEGVVDLESDVVRRGPDLWLAPPDLPLDVTKLNRPGAKLLGALAVRGKAVASDTALAAALHSGQVKCFHDFAVHIGPRLVDRRSAKLQSDTQLIAYLRGDDLRLPRHCIAPPDGTLRGAVLVVVHPTSDLVLGLAKVVGGNKEQHNNNEEESSLSSSSSSGEKVHLKNQLPRDLLRRDVVVLPL